MESTITTKGQATVPKEVRDFLNLHPGDKVRWFIQADGHVVILPTLPITALRGIVKSKRKDPIAQEEIDQAIAHGASERYQRTRHP